MIQDSEDAVSRDFERILPSTYSLADVNRLPWNTLRDDCSGDESFIDADSTWVQWLGKAVTGLKQAYLDESETRHRIMVNGKPSLAAFNQVLVLDQHLQGSFVGSIEGTTGVPPRVVTMRDYRYRCDEEEKRNLFLTLSSVVLEGGKQKSESRSFGEREFVIRALLPRSGEKLVRYLALIRQALLAIMKDYHWHTDSIRAYETRILAKPAFHKGANGAWSPTEISNKWHELAAPYIGDKITILDARQFVTGIFRQHYPWFLKEQSSKSAIDAQGDHIKKGRCTDNHYGRSDGLCNGNSALDTADCVLASRVYQATMESFPVDQDWPESVTRSPVLRREDDRKFGVDVARYRIHLIYGFSKLQPEAIRTRVESLCLNLPFIFAEDV
jgi:hypothetical protein